MVPGLKTGACTDSLTEQNIKFNLDEDCGFESHSVDTLNGTN